MRATPAWLAVASTSLTLATGPLHAQPVEEAPEVAIGSRVMVAAPGVTSQPRTVGRVAGLTADSLRLGLRDRSEPLVIPFDSISAMSVSLGVRAHAGTGAALGAVAGPAVMFLGCELGHACLFHPGGTVVIGAFLGLVVGGLIGLPSEEWREVPLEDLRARLRLQPGGGAELELRLSLPGR